MGLLDDVVDGLSKALGLLVILITGPRRVINGIFGDEADVEETTAQVGQALEDSQPADELAGVTVGILEEAILADLQEQGEVVPEDAEGLAQDIEGGSVATILGLGAVGTAIEAAGVGQLETQQEFLMQAIAGLQLDDVTGTELEARLAEGVQPALEAQVGKQHRAKFVDLADAVEYALRNKEEDQGWLRLSNVSGDVRDRIASNNQVSEENILEEWGIRDDQLPILEEVGIAVMEPEELLETPVEAGVFPDPKLVEEELDRAGVSEGVKGLFREVAEELPTTVRAYQENPEAEVLVQQLDRLVQDDALSPQEAAGRVEFLREETRTVLQARWERLSSLPNSAPTRAQVEGGFTNGLIGLSKFLDLLDQVDVDPEAHPYVPQEAILSELDGDLRQAVGLGLLEEGQYTEYARTAGLDEETVSRLLQGEDLDEIAESRLQAEVDQGTLPVDTVAGIGSSRRQTLEAAGLETVQALVNADPGQLLEVLDVSEETAQEFITRAGQLTG